MLSSYLKRHAFKPSYFLESPSSNLGLIVVIPAHNEISLIKAVESLFNCSKPNQDVEVILVFNASEQDKEDIIHANENAASELKKWHSVKNNQWFNLLIFEENSLPQKHAGVGLARKIGMDEAVRRFLLANNPKGIICCFDADSYCKKNYFIEIEEHFKRNPTTEACSIYFEHPTTGDEYTKEIYWGIIYYELFLRYYKNGLAYAHLPFAYHTIGSSMAVKAEAYCKEGGMNKRKAGEDFYFLQKFISIDKLSELNSTAVFPSPRPSNRVPFGTGRAIEEMISGTRDITLAISFEIFQEMKACFYTVKDWYHNKPEVSKTFLDFVGGEDIFQKKIEEIRSQSVNSERFYKRFFQWFNAFKALKFAHYLRDNKFSSKPIVEEAAMLLKALNEKIDSKSPFLLLKKLRELDG